MMRRKMTHVGSYAYLSIPEVMFPHKESVASVVSLAARTGDIAFDRVLVALSCSTALWSVVSWMLGSQYSNRRR